MKIRLEQNEFKFEFETPKHFSESFAHKAVSAFYRLINDTESESTVATPVKEEHSVQIQTVQSERPAFRDRLPNNIIDIKDLDIKQAVTEEALVRCPHCGQAHCLAVNAGSKVYLMERDFNSNEFNIIAEFDSLTSSGFVNVCCKPDTNRLDYFSDLQNAPVVSYEDFVANNETEVFCPVCCTSYSFMDWKDAYENPLKYFETEHLCDVCGGEKVERLIKNNKVYHCESCGFQSDFKEA